MKYLSLQYEWNADQSIDLTLTFDQGKLVRVYDDHSELPLVAQQLTGLSFLTEESVPLRFIKKELNLVQPLLALNYLKQLDCPTWLVPLHQHIHAQKSSISYSSGYEEVDRLYRNYQHVSRYPQVKSLLGIFSDQTADKLKTIGFIDKLGPAAEIFITHKMEEPNDDVKTKVRAAQQRFAVCYS